MLKARKDIGRAVVDFIGECEAKYKNDPKVVEMRIAFNSANPNEIIISTRFLDSKMTVKGYLKHNMDLDSYSKSFMKGDLC